MRLRLSFGRLQTKLTVLYAALLGVTLLAISAAVYVAVSGAAQGQVRGELTASGTVFDRVWSMRSDQLRQGAALLSRDFGFREAVATGDRATIVSAMENLRSRFSTDLAFIVNVDGSVIAADSAGIAADAPALLDAFYDMSEPSGVAVLGGAPYQIIAAPILSPDLKGWVVFAARLDAREMTALEKLSAIPLQALVVHRTRQGWTAGSPLPKNETSAVNAFIDRHLKASEATPRALDGPHGRSIALVKPLPTLIEQDRAALLLRYPLSLALAPYHALLATVVLTGLAGLLVAVWGSWALARGVTRPISALDDAARRLQHGEEAQVEIETADEIGRLADTFNRMATEIRERERKITHLALHDEETGLPNRLSLERALDELAQAGVTSGLYVAAIGVDRFAHVRGAIGYEFAALLMRMVGDRLGALVSRDKVARLSTEVLGCVITARDQAEADAACARLLAALELPVSVGDDTIDVALSIGLAPLSEAADTAGGAVEMANIALDQARAGRRKTAVFDAKAYGDPSSNLSLMSGMLAALESGDICLFHQPKLDVRKGGITGVEALVRWRHPARGMLAPDLFIPMAEETGHIRTLTDWVLTRAIEDQRVMAEAGHELEMSVNISGRLLGDRDFLAFAVAEVAKAHGRICFEITETAVIENPDLALEILDAFAEAGISISIDDFGTGLSSLAYLKRIKGEELKIDKSIIQGVTESRRDALIVRSVVDMAHSLGLKVTAEGVETQEMLAALATMGCDIAQGYLIAKPQPLTELLTFLQKDSANVRHYG